MVRELFAVSTRWETENHIYGRRVV